MIRAIFEELKNKQIKPVVLPWGTLPYLRYGRIYVDGCITEKSVGDQFEVVIPENIHSQIVNGFEIPSSIWPLFKNPLFGCQKVWSFFLEKNYYIIPCLEVIRAFLTPYKTLTNQIISPDGLDFFIDREQCVDKQLYMELNRNFPGTLLHDAVIAHLAWLRYNVAGKKAWESVYNRLFIESVQRNSLNPSAHIRSGIPLECKAPIDVENKLTCRGLSIGNIKLVLEIDRVDGIRHPFKFIDYTHPLLKRTEPNTEGSSSTIRRSAKGNDDTEQHPSGESARNDSNHQIIEGISCSFSFQNKPVVRRKRTGKRNVSSSDEAKIFGNENSVTTQVPESGGKIRPIEFRGLQIVHSVNGLEGFLSTLDLIAAKNIGWDIIYTIIDLPDEFSFSRIPDGSKRVCAIVTIMILPGDTVYLIEIARPDDWSVATLLFWPTEKRLEDDFVKMTREILSGLCKNKGHWDVAVFDNYSKFAFEKIIHSKSAKERWAERIISKIQSK